MHRKTVLGIVIGAGCLLAGIRGYGAAVRAGEGDKPPDHTVILQNIEFRPNRIMAKANETIRFTNRDKFQHDVYLVRTANRNDVLVDATTIDPGKSVTITVDQDGLFTLYCTIHGGMTGKVSTTGTFELTEEEKKRAAARKVIPPIVKTGEALYWGRAQCHRCHMVGERGYGLRGPNHQDLGFRARARAKKVGLDSATEYITQSILEPSAHIVEGYSDDMPNVYQPPINLSEDDIKALIAYLQAQGGEVDTWTININPQILSRKLEPSPFAHADPKRGRQVFVDMGCQSCHTVGTEEGISIAPDLTGIGAYRNWTWLTQAIVDPNAEIGANWKDATVYLKPGITLKGGSPFESDEEFDEDAFDDEAAAAASPGDPDSVEARIARARSQMEELLAHIATLERQRSSRSALAVRNTPAADATASVGRAAGAPPTADATSADAPVDFVYGQSVPGVLRKETSEEVTLLVAQDQYETFTRDQIAGVVLSTKSRMATNYGQLMTFRQLGDLVSYLATLRGPTDPAEKKLTLAPPEKPRHTGLTDGS